MADSSINPENNLFNIRSTLSNEHLVFADTLRDWHDPLLQGYEPISVPLCPRCATCKCESLKDLHQTSSNSIHHHKHESSCPHFRHQYERTKSSNKQHMILKPKRRAISHDPSLAVLNTSSSSSSIIKSKSADHALLTYAIKREKSTSKIPVRISTSTNEYSPSSSSSSIIKDRSLYKKTKIPQLILTRSLPLPTITTTTDDLYEIDSLNDDDDVYQTPATMSDDEDTISKKKKINQLDNMDEQILIKKKKRVKSNTSTSDKQRRRYRHKEGRHSKSKSTSNDLSSSSSSSSSSLSVVPLRKRSHPRRLSSPSQILSSLSDDSLSDKIKSKQSRQSRPRSAFVSTNHSSPPSVYLIQLANKINPPNSFGLTKTTTYIWKTTNSNSIEENELYPHYSIEQVQPIINQNKRSIPISSRNIILERGQTDYWQNCETSPDLIITSSCQNSTGSASHLLSSSTEPKTPTNSNGHIISVTTTKRCQPSLLNTSKNIQWNIEGDGKQFRYSQIKSRTKHGTDSNTDIGSSSEQNNRFIPIIHHQTDVPDEIHEVLENVSMDVNSKQTNLILPELSKPILHSNSKQISYASTDEDVDELNSHYSEDIDRSISAAQNSREKLNIRLLSLNNEPNEYHHKSIIRPRILSTEYSQITFDSGVDINSDQKIYQPNTTLTIDEQSSEETIDQNELFALSDDSLIEIELKSPRNNLALNQNELSLSLTQTEPESYYSARSELNNDKDLYSGYELVSITDEDEDYPVKNDSKEFIITSELSTPTPPPPPPRPPPSSFRSSLPPQFDFKLPSFGEWIDRVFTSFLTENNPNPPESISSSRSSIVSIHGSQNTINTSSSSQVITVLENQNFQNKPTLHQTQSWPRDEEQDDEHSLNDMSSSSLNCDEKVDFDTYIINSNYEKINPSITNEILFINERSKSLLSSITSSIENDDQEVMNNERMQNDEDKFLEINNSKQILNLTNSHDSLLQSNDHINTTTSSSIDDLTRTNQFVSSIFYSKDSALGLSDDHLNHQNSSLIILQDKIVDNNEIMINIDNNIIQKNTIMNEIQLDEHDQSIERTISSSSSEQLIPKEKQTGMYYKAFGSSAAIHLAEQYRCEWLQEVSTPVLNEKLPEIDDNQLRIVHQCQTLGDNEDEFYFSPQILHPSYSCPNLNSNPNESLIYQRSYSLTTLDAYTHLNITHETLEQIWLSLLDVAFSDKDDYELGEYKLRHIIGLSNSYSNINHTLIEKSRSHNDIFSINSKTNQKPITKIKSKSFDVTSLIKQSSSSSIINDSANVGLLQGADISEPFVDRLISTSMHSDLESIQSLEHEQILNENPSPPSPLPTIKEPLNYVFNYSHQLNNDEYDFEIEDKSLNTSLLSDNEDIPLPIIHIRDTYTELALFRPHSLSTIPSSRASQYASSVGSDDIFEGERQINKENSEEINQYHVSDDDHGVIGSEFSSPQSRPLSSIQSRPLSPEQNPIKSTNFSNIDHDAWERSINEPIFYDDLSIEYNPNEEYSTNLIPIIPLESSSDHQQTYIIDQIEPILVSNEKHQETFIEKIDENLSHSLIQQDYLTIEQQSDPYLDPDELSHRLEQLDLSNKTLITKEEEEEEDVTNLHLIQHPLLITKPTTHLPLRYQTQRIDKVSDLEIVKQGKGFKIGYIDRQGTDQRIILTKRIEAGPDIMERDPHIRLPYKGRRILNQIFSSVLYTNGYNKLQEDDKFQHSAKDIEVSIIGTNPKHFDESDMVSIDIDGPSTMLNSICEAIVITQGSVYTKPTSNQNEEYLLQTSYPIKKDKIQVIDSWHDQTIINGSSASWRSPFKPPKSIKQEKSTRDIALSPIQLFSEIDFHTISTSPITIIPETVDRSCQYSPPVQHDQGLQCYFDNTTSYTQVSSHEIPGYLRTQIENTPIRTLLTLERSADSGILIDDNHRLKSNLAVQVDMKSSSSDSEDMSEITTQRTFSNHHIYENSIVDISTSEIEQEILQLRRERSHILDLLSLNWNRSNIWVELTEAKLNYIIGETDALLRSLSFDPSPTDNETVKLKMHQYEEDMAELTRQHLAVYRERLEDSKKQLDMKIDELELKKSSIENQAKNHLITLEQNSHLTNTKRIKSFLSTSADNLTQTSHEDTIASHPQLLDISFLTSKHSNQNENIYRPVPRYSTRNLSDMEGLSQSQQAIIDETDQLVKDSQQLHTESATQFERARESLLSSETSIRLAQANMAASRYSERKTYLPNDVTLAELFKYEQSLVKEASKTNRHIYS